METITRMETEHSYQEFRELTDWQRMKIAAENPVINTDTYNRTMDYLRGPEGWREQETYTLQMRRSPYDYLVVAGVEDMVEELSRPITQAQLDFAEAFYAERSIPFFNKAMWQTIIDDYDGKLPIEIHGAPDGTVLLPGEPVFRVTGPGELIAHFEHIFHRPFYSTLVATKAHEITKLLGDPKRFIEVGKRGTPDEMTHLMAVKAMQIGGDLNLTSNDAGAAVFEDVMPVGTIGHRYVQRFPSVEAAFRHAIENLDAVSLLVDLVDSYDGMDLALRLKQEYRHTGKKIGIRLDSGDIGAQTRYYLDRCNELGFMDPDLDKIVVEGFDTLDDVRAIEATISDVEKQRVLYGAGGMLVSQHTSRSDASTGFKLSEYENVEGVLVPTSKKSNSPGKESIPGRPTVAIINGVRTIAQDYEAAGNIDLFQPLFIDGDKVPTGGISAARQRRTLQYEALRPMIESKARSKISPETARKIGEVMCRYGIDQGENQ